MQSDEKKKDVRSCQGRCDQCKCGRKRPEEQEVVTPPRYKSYDGVIGSFSPRPGFKGEGP